MANKKYVIYAGCGINIYDVSKETMSGMISKYRPEFLEDNDSGPRTNWKQIYDKYETPARFLVDVINREESRISGDSAPIVTSTENGPYVLFEATGFPGDDPNPGRFKRISCREDLVKMFSRYIDTKEAPVRDIYASTTGMGQYERNSS